MNPGETPNARPAPIGERAPRSLPQALLIRAATTLAGWPVALLLVLAVHAGFDRVSDAISPLREAVIFSGVLVITMGNVVMPLLTRVICGALGGTRSIERPRAVAHAQLPLLPEWPVQTIGALATSDGDAVHVIPISAPVRVGDRRILFSLQRGRGSLHRLRARPSVALLLLGKGNVAATARGQATIMAEAMSSAPDYAAIALDVEHLDDHRQAAFVIEAGVDRRWLDERERDSLRARVAELSAAATREVSATTQEKRAS